MNNMNGMPGMPNGMYGGFGGNMNMGMNDMSAMMNYGGGYGNGWNGMGGAGYGSFSGYPQMGGYNQTGSYPPEMMNHFRNNFSNQNRPHPNGGNFQSQRVGRNGSFGAYGRPGMQANNSRPGSQSGLPNQVRRFHDNRSRQPNPAARYGTVPFLLPKSKTTDQSVLQQRDGQSPDGTANAAAESNGEDEQAKASAETPQEGKNDATAAPGPSSEASLPEGAASAEATKGPDDLTQTAGSAPTGPANLNHIQTVDSVEGDGNNFDPSVMDNGMQYPAQMMNSFQHHPHMNGPFNANMGFHQNSFGHRGGISAAYGAATVLTGEPRGVGVEGAPTGPRAMREGRPNTGFSSRINNARYNATLASAAAASSEPAPASPSRRVRS